LNGVPWQGSLVESGVKKEKGYVVVPEKPYPGLASPIFVPVEVLV
jgi:hypothetical protein